MSDADCNDRRERERLCRICRKIDFDRYLGEAIKEALPLGSWQSIRQSRDCPFCRLVVRSIESNLRLTPLSPAIQIVLLNEASWKLGVELSPYDRSRSDSYSNKFDLRSKAQEIAKKWSHIAFRFIVLALQEADTDHDRNHDDVCDDDYESPIGMIQYLAHKEGIREKRRFFGRRVNAEKVDIKLLVSWLDRCSDWHNGECERDVRTVDSLPLNLRLIDVQRRCIVKMSRGEVPPYVALSYMWGSRKMKKETGAEPAMLLRKDIRLDLNGEEMTPLGSKVPRTIEDAMTLTRLLGCRYLWNDALCIIQDATLDEKIPDLTNMKLIYSSASVTIAAAAGAHEDYGIPGIGVTRKIHQYSEVVDGLRLATMFPSFTTLETSSELLWNTRGWTFQEKLLSKRLLLFTDSQVYFKCSESIWTEEIAMETERLSKSVESRRAKYSWRPDRKRHVPSERAIQLKSYDPRLKIEDEWNYLGSFLDYAAAIEEFSKRQLTDSKDTLFAVSGILETFQNTTGRFTLGLPMKHFLESLLWYPNIGCLQTYNSTLNLPSWTWASSHYVQGGVKFDLMDARQLRNLLMISIRAFHKDEDEEKDLSISRPVHQFQTAINRGSAILPMMGTHGNLAACLTRPLVEQNHTVRKIFYVNSAGMEQINFQLPVSALDLPDHYTGQFIPQLIKSAQRYARSGNQNWKPSSHSLAVSEHALAFETVVVQFTIGKSLHQKAFLDENEVGIFELKDSDGRVVGEIITTYRRANTCRKPEDFLTISWGLSLQKAAIDRSWVPRWAYDGDESAQAYSSKSMKDQRAEALRSVVLSELGFLAVVDQLRHHEVGQWIPKKLLSSLDKWKEHDPAVGLFDELYSAKKGAPIPRSLWPVVNLILVDWHWGKARRAGVGKVIMKAWHEQSTLLQEVILI